MRNVLEPGWTLKRRLGSGSCCLATCIERISWPFLVLPLPLVFWIYSCDTNMADMFWSWLTEACHFLLQRIFNSKIPCGRNAVLLLKLICIHISRSDNSNAADHIKACVYRSGWGHSCMTEMFPSSPNVPLPQLYKKGHPHGEYGSAAYISRMQYEINTDQIRLSVWHSHPSQMPHNNTTAETGSCFCMKVFIWAIFHHYRGV